MRSLFRSSRATSALVSLIVALAVWLMGACGLLGPVERAGRDAATRLASAWPAAIPYALPGVAVVVADSPLSLEHCAGAIRRLEAAGVRGIALDLGTLPPDDSPGVKSLVRAIVESGKVALAVGAEHDLSATMLSERAAALGHIAIDADVDGVVRHASYSSATPLGRLPILGAVALEVAGVAPAALQDGEFAIDFRRTRPHFAVISLSDLLGDRFDPGAVAGRVVFIAATLEPSLHTTPIAPATPSAYLHATGYRTLAAAHAGEPVPHARPLWRGWLWAGALSLALGAISGMPGIARLTILLLTGVALIAAAPLGAVAFGVLDPPVAAFLIFAAHCVLASDRLRSRLGLQPDPEEFSLALLAGARNATLGGRAGTDRDLEVPLAMMGRAVGATAVSLVRFAASATSINWRPGLPDEFRCPQVGSLDIARRVAERGEVEFCEGALPADPVAWLRPSSTLYVPMLDEGTSMGVLVIEGEGRTPFEAFELQTIAGAAAQLALILRNRALLEDVQTTFRTAWTAVARAVEARDGYTEIHTPRMVSCSRRVAERLGICEADVAAIELGALLHDVGKIGIRDSVLNKPAPFTPEERRDMERHPLIGVQLLGSIHGLAAATLDCVRHHHESWDGSGYPDGLAGEQIPLSARIVCVVDVWDAMRGNHAPFDGIEAGPPLEALRKLCGVRFDPAVVDAMFAVLDEDGDDL